MTLLSSNRRILQLSKRCLTVLTLPLTIFSLACQKSNSPPARPNTPQGPTTGAVNVTSYFRALGFDPDYDRIAYRFIWGDGSKSAWSEYVPSGQMESLGKSYNRVGNYQVRVIAKDPYGAVSDTSDALLITILATLPNRPPATPDIPVGPESTIVGCRCTFRIVTTDPDGDNLAYQFDWGDGRTSGWSGWVQSGVTVTDTCSWSAAGSYSIRGMARDQNGTISDWSPPHIIVVLPSQQ